MKFVEAAGSKWVTPSWVAKARIKKLKDAVKTKASK